MKGTLIQEIEAIYRDHNFSRKGKPLQEFDEEQLRVHLDKLRAGETPFESPPRKKKTRSTRQ